MRSISAVLFMFFSALSLAAAAVPGVAQNRTVFGIELGARFNIAKCAPEEGSYPAKPCFKGGGAAPEAWGGHDYHVFLPSVGTPAFVRGELIVSVKDGIVESVHINTWGFEAQFGAMSALKKQFGEPTRTSLKEGRNATRTRNRAQLAEWEFSDFSVKYDAVTGSIDWGQIKIATNRYTKLMNEFEKHKARPALKP